MMKPRKNFSVHGRIEALTTPATATVEAPFEASSDNLEVDDAVVTIGDYFEDGEEYTGTIVAINGVEADVEFDDGHWPEAQPDAPRPGIDYWQPRNPSPAA